MIRRIRRLVYVAFALGTGVLAIGAIFAQLPWGRGVAIEPSAPPLPSAAQDDASSFDAVFAEGVAALREHQPLQAAALFQVALKLQPESAAALTNLGFSYLQLDMHRAAAQAFERALEADPMVVNAYYGLAETSEALGDLEAAVGAMQTYVHLTAADDPYRRRAMSAVWEWQEQLQQRAGTDLSPAPGMQAGWIPAPRSTLQVAAANDAGDADLDLERYAGKTVVLNIWATWCPPCRAELASLARLDRSLRERGAVVVAVSIDEDPSFVAEYLRDNGLAFDSYVDADQSLTRDVLGVEMIPTTVIIDGDGAIRSKIVGARDWDSADATALVLDHKLVINNEPPPAGGGTQN
ncbi:MAG: redoxin family protein [Hyphomicrobiaceae bacterium]